MPHSAKHDAAREAVALAFEDAAASRFQGALLDGALRLWNDFAATCDLSRTRKPEAWAAALFYVFDRLELGGLSQEDVAQHFGVSAITVSQKYRQMAEALDLVLVDPRYLPEARRAAVRRDLGTLPDALPLLEASTGYWPMPFAFRTADPLYAAQERVYDGWEALSAGRLSAAEQHFKAALDADPFLADAYNGLAGIAEAQDDLATALDHYGRAYELARETLGTEDPEAYYWWGELETRPYMRARQGRAWIYWQLGRPAKAAAEYEAMLRLNPNDNQGVRYLVGPMYQLAGDLDRALQAYARYTEHYPDDMGDPHHAFSWGLALYAAGDVEAALRRWRPAFFQNIYLAPLLLDEPPPEEDIWHGTNLAMRDYAEDYLDLFGDLWEHAPEARSALRRLWHSADVQALVQRWLEIGRDLNTLSVMRAQTTPDEAAEDRAVQWRQLIDKRFALERRVDKR